MNDMVQNPGSLTYSISQTGVDLLFVDNTCLLNQFGQANFLIHDIPLLKYT